MYMYIYIYTLHRERETGTFVDLTSTWALFGYWSPHCPLAGHLCAVDNLYSPHCPEGGG